MEHAFQHGVPGAKHGETGAGGDNAVDALAEDVHALLRCQPADNREEHAGTRLQPERLLDRPPVFGAAAERRSVVGGGERAVGGRIPDVGIDAVEDAGQHVAAGAQQAVEAHAARRRADFGGIGGADGGDGVGELESRPS